MSNSGARHTDSAGNPPLELHRYIENESDESNQSATQPDAVPPQSQVVKDIDGVILKRAVEDTPTESSEVKAEVADRELKSLGNQKLKPNLDQQKNKHSSALHHPTEKSHTTSKHSATDEKVKDPTGRNKLPSKHGAQEQNGTSGSVYASIPEDEEEPHITMEDIKKVKAPNMFERIHEEFEAIAGSIKDKIHRRHKR